MATQRKVGTTGASVSGDDELEQSLRLLLTVRRNSIPHRPDLGGELFELIDAPLDVARAKAPLLVLRAAAADSRLVVESTSVTMTTAGELQLEVHWHPASSPASTCTTEVTVA
jgi:phage baseplate assembly protein W